MGTSSAGAAASFLSVDKLFFSLLFLLVGYWHYVRFIEDNDEDEEYQAFRWRYFSWKEFKELNSTDPDLLYLSLYGYVFNVTAAPYFYKPGEGGYAIFHGRECTRAMALASLEPDDLDANLRGLSDAELLEGLDTFEETYLAKYPIMGRIRRAELPWRSRMKLKGQGDHGTTTNSKDDAEVLEKNHKIDGEEDVGDEDHLCDNLPPDLTAECRNATTTASSSSPRRKSRSQNVLDFDETQRQQQEEEDLAIFRPRPFHYDPRKFDYSVEERGGAKAHRRKGTCPMRKVTEAAVKVYRIVRDAIPLLTR